MLAKAVNIKIATQYMARQHDYTLRRRND